MAKRRQLRIQGLVRASRHVRAALQAGVPAEEQAGFKRRLRALLRDVEVLCRKHRTTPESLPTPSRNAYRFLKGIDLERLPHPSAERGPASVAGSVSLRNVVKAQNTLSGMLWLELLELLESPERREGVHLTVVEQVTRIEAICAENQVTPAALSRPSQRAYCWFRYLAEPVSLQAYLDTLAMCSALAERWLEEQFATLEVHLLVMSPLWRRTTEEGHHVLKVNAAMIAAPQEVWRALVRDALSGSGGSSEGLVARFAESEAYAEMLDELMLVSELFGEDESRGVVHDLEQSFARVNAHYFAGELSRPRLRWSERLTSRRFGHYQSGRDTVVLSASLDSEAVPEQVLDFVMYHELLHKQLGVQIIGGRRVAHSPAFREAERRFEGYEEAERALSALASQLA